MDMPCNNTAEQNVLGVLMVANKIDELMNEYPLNIEDFYIQEHQGIFKAILKLYKDNKAIDIVTLSSVVVSIPECSGGVEYLKEIASNIVTSRNLRYYAEIVKDCSKRRQFIRLAKSIQSAAADMEYPVENISPEIDKYISQKENSKSLICASDIMIDLYKYLAEAQDKKGQLPGMSTGWESIDKAMGGLEKGTLTVVAGRPGMGKSIFGANIAENAVFNLDKTALYFSLEMPQNQVLLRICSSNSGCLHKNFKYGIASDDDWTYFTETATNKKLNNLYIDDTSDIDVTHVKSCARYLKRKHKEIGVIIIDYLQLMRTNKRDTRTNEVGEITRELKQLAKELDCPIVLLSQLSRSNERRDDKRPTLSDLRDSGAVEQDADNVFMLYREDYYSRDSPKTRIADIILAKLREGTPGTVKLSWQPQIMRFMEIEEVKRIAEEKKKEKEKKYGKQVEMR